MNWTILFIAGLFEVAWAIGLKYTAGFTKLWPSVYTLATMAASIYFLSIAVKTLPIGTAYAVWTGIGAVGTVLVGIVFLGEPHNIMRLLCITLIIMGIAGLRFFA